MKYIKIYLVTAFVSLFFTVVTHSQEINVDRFEYISPEPSSSFVSPLNNIVIRQGDLIDVNSMSVEDLIIVEGSKSGLHKVDLNLLDDGTTIIFKPTQAFSEGEQIIVRLKSGLKTIYNEDIGELKFEFYISDSWQKNINDINSKILLDEIKMIVPKTGYDDNSFSMLNFQSNSDTLELPNLYVTVSNDPTEGYIFISPWFYQGNFLDPNYIIISDNYGIPIYYKAINALALDFKIQPNGLLTYHDRSTILSYGMDSSYNVVDTFACGNGYTTGFHDLQILPNNHYLAMSYDAQTVRMDTIVAGGDTAANVIGLIIQELDQNDNVVFQWRSWDHFQITDASNNIDLTAHTIDYVHGNSIEMDYDGNIIISSRHLNEVTKISRSTGDIIWRLGGKKNQFQFTNDNRGFTYQHDARRLPNNNLTIFDNGNLSSPQYSSAIEYQMDEQNKTVTRVWDYSDNNAYSRSMGSTTRLDNGRTIIGWGGLHDPAITEVDSNGIKKFEMAFDESVFSYRAFRHTWRTNLITSDSYNVNFGFVAINDSAVQQISITNNSNEVKVINSFFSRTNLFTVVDVLPISLQPMESKIFQIQFFPDSVGAFSDDIHLRIDEGNEMIAQVISVSGFSDPSIPVELIFFNAVSEDGKVMLNWSTSTEINNLGFDVERTSPHPPPYQGGGDEAGGGWQKIGFVKGHGTTTEQQQYSYVDDIADVRSQSIYYRLKQIDLDGSYNYSEVLLVENVLPASFILHQNFPNPFNPSTKIRYSISAVEIKYAVFVQLKIYDVLGNEVAILVNEQQAAGNYEVELSEDFIIQSTGAGLSSGIYFYKLSAGEFTETKKMVIIR
jgi:hypothetical protein